VTVFLPGRGLSAIPMMMRSTFMWLFTMIAAPTLFCRRSIQNSDRGVRPRRRKQVGGGVHPTA
jgi:hypothetical protein